MIWVSLFSSLQNGVEITTLHLPAPPIARLCPGVRCPPPLSLPFRRFHCSLTDNNRWIRERSHESYAKNYSVVFPHDEPLAGRNMRKDPLHQELLQQGCVFQERHGWERPGWFSPGGAAPVSTVLSVRDVLP